MEFNALCTRPYPREQLLTTYKSIRTRPQHINSTPELHVFFAQMAVFAAVTFGLLMGFLAVRHRAMARWNTVAGLAVPILFLVRVCLAYPARLMFRDILPQLLPWI